MLRRGRRRGRRGAADLSVACAGRTEHRRDRPALERPRRAHAEKQTRIVEVAREGFDFLGWHFRGNNKKWPRKKSVQKLKDKLRPLTRRTNGRSLADIIATANPILRGWHGYFRDSVPSGLKDMDGWVRRRLRAMLRKREKRPAFGSNRNDHTRWPNRWFAARGLFSLELGSRTYG